MWNVNGQDLKMCRGDWGIRLPITVSGVTLSNNDELLFVLKKQDSGSAIITKTFSHIVNNTINLEFTENESNLLPVGGYVYSLDWYQNGAFLCNIIPSSLFKVVAKA